MSYSHKSGSLKQQNKKHKAAKKRSISNSNVTSRKSSKLMSKQQRLSFLKQKRTLRTSMLKNIMLFRGIAENPIWCVFVPITPTVPVHLASVLFQKCDPEAVVSEPNGLQGVVQLYSRMFDKHFCLVSSKFDDIFGCIDLIHIADHVILLVPSDLTELDWATEAFLTTVFAQGLPEATFAVMSSGANLKMIKSVLQLRFPVPDDAVFHFNTPAHAVNVMRRVCSSFRADPLKYHSSSECSHSAARFRSKMLASNISLSNTYESRTTDETDETNPSESYLYIHGQLRGSPLYFRDPLEQLTGDAKGPFVHLSGWGDFPLASAYWKDTRSGAQRWSVTDLTHRDENPAHFQRTSTVSVISPCDTDDSEGSNSMDSIQMSLDEKIVPEDTPTSYPDTVVNTDTDADGWDDSLSEYVTKTTASSRTSGFSAAQLAKFRAARNEELFPDEVETPPFLPARERFSKYRSLPKFHVSIWPAEKDVLPSHYENIACFRNYHRNRRSIVRYLQKRFGTVERDQSFVSKYIPAGAHVQLCLGPLDKETINAIMNHHHALEHPNSSEDTLRPHPLVVWSLLPHESRISVCHFSMRRVSRAMQALSDVISLANAANKANESTTLHSMENAPLEFGEEAFTRMEMENQAVQDAFSQYKNASVRRSNSVSDAPTLPPEAEPIKSKELMLFQVGIRRFISCPIYSTQTSSANEKAKFEQFFSATQPTVVATVYAPVMYAPANVLQFRVRVNESEDGELSQPYLGELVATGTLHSVDPSRLILKRIFLSGHPYKIRNRNVVVRFMFFNPTDVQYFKAVPLQTKSGACGYIKEPVGTHGHMKCVFDKQLQASDVVLLPLYKRIFPKWLYQPMVVRLFRPLRQRQSSLTRETAPVTLQLHKKRSSSSAENAHHVSGESSSDVIMA